MTKAAKKPWYSKTLWAFTLVMGTGGIDLLIQFLRDGNFDPMATVILMLGVMGIALRLATTQPVSMQ
jgi:hypothetical protein